MNVRDFLISLVILGNVLARPAPSVSATASEDSLVVELPNVIKPKRPRRRIVPAEATRAAEDYLEFVKKRANEETGFWRSKWKYTPVCEQDSIKLGVPYVEYIVTREKVREFAITADLMNSVSFYAFTYPVYDCSELMGAIQIGDRRGKWNFAGRLYKYDDSIKRILELRGQFKPEDGCSVVYLRAIKGFGVSIVILLNGQPHMIMPRSVWTRREFTGDNYYGKYPLLKAEEVLPVFVRCAREYKDRSHEHMQSEGVE